MYSLHWIEIEQAREAGGGLLWHWVRPDGSNAIAGVGGEEWTQVGPVLVEAPGAACGPLEIWRMAGAVLNEYVVPPQVNQADVLIGHVEVRPERGVDVVAVVEAPIGAAPSEEERVYHWRRYKLASGSSAESPLAGGSAGPRPAGADRTGLPKAWRVRLHADGRWTDTGVAVMRDGVWVGRLETWRDGVAVITGGEDPLERGHCQRGVAA